MGNPGPRQEISLISYPAVLDISEIKLIRTDTTLDLSQKAEKVCPHPRTLALGMQKGLSKTVARRPSRGFAGLEERHSEGT